MKVQHHGGLDHRCVLERKAGESVGKDGGQRFCGAEIPVFEAHHRKTRGAAFAKCEIDPLDHEPLVLVVTVDEYQAFDTVSHEFPNRIADLTDESRCVEACGTAEVLSTAAFWLGFIPVRQCRGDDAIHRRGGAGGDGGRQQSIRPQR